MYQEKKINCKFLEMLEVNTIKQIEMKDEIEEDTLTWQGN